MLSIRNISAIALWSCHYNHLEKIPGQESEKVVWKMCRDKACVDEKTIQLKGKKSNNGLDANPKQWEMLNETVISHSFTIIREVLVLTLSIFIALPPYRRCTDKILFRHN